MAETSHAPSADRRPSTKALLELANNEARGKLKIFLGMAPGVGKTYAMLSAARAAKADGVDVVVGVVETHGRDETAALLDGLEVLARRTVPYRQRTLMEFDVEAAIKRRPELLLIDEFAHTNAPGLRHAKRYRDVEEVLRAGIDVWTTLNVQHIESLTDVVERITGITVRETVPDKVLDAADELVVVDLPPEDLIQRLKEGKVYLPDNARRAIDQFFLPGNLTALRELALRRTADRVDEQMMAQLRRRGIEGPWPTAERLLVCVGEGNQSEAVVRAAARMAAALKSDWTAIHLDRGDRAGLSRAAVRRTEKGLRLAERLGATTARLIAKDLTGEILAFARRNNITQIVVGRSRSRLLGAFGARRLSDELIAKAAGLSITVVAPEARAPAAPLLELPKPHVALKGGAASVAAVGLAVLAGVGLEQLTILPNLSMVFLLAVFLTAIGFGMWPAVAAAALSFFAYDFFFIDPLHTLTVSAPHEFLALVIFLVVAVVTGGLAGRLREQASAIQGRALATQALYDFSRKLSGAATLDDVVWLLAAQSGVALKSKSIVLLADHGDLSIRGGWPPEDELSTTDWAAARWAMDKALATGRFSDTLPLAQYHFRPLVSSKGALGVVGVAPVEPVDGLTSAEESAFQSFLDQAATAIERTMLVEQAASAEASVEAEKLRSALLSSISHDLKTPLASIVGSVTSLRQLGDKMSKADRADLLATIEEEAARLSRFVTNLLDMTRLEAGSLDVRRAWVDIGDIVRAGVARAKTSFPSRRTKVDVEADLPLVRGDATLLQQVLFNLLDNAHKYSAPQSVTEIKVRRAGGDATITVADQGIGIPREALHKVFEKFYRVAAADGRAPGTGLGLSIAAGIVTAMGGQISAESPIAGEGGTRVTIVLPATASPDERDGSP